MNKNYQIKIINAEGKSVTEVIKPGPGKGPTVIKAVGGTRYALVDTEQGSAPDNIRIARSGKNIKIFFDANVEPGLVIENFYEVHQNTQFSVVGQNELGNYYEYIPETASDASTVGQLKDSGQTFGMALGGEKLAGAAAGLQAAPVAAMGFSPLMLGAGLLGIAAAAGGGGGSAPPPAKPTVSSAKLTEDSGPPLDNITNQTNPTVTGVATPGSSITLTVNNKNYQTTANATTGIYVFKIPDADALPQGRYTPVAKASLNGVESDLFNGIPFTIDLSNRDNPNTTGTPVADPNSSAIVAISSITTDSGPKEDFITNDNTLRFKGKAESFIQNGDRIEVILKRSDGTTVASDYLNVINSGSDWEWNREGATLPDGQYTLSARVVDGAGNPVTEEKTKVIVIDTLAGFNINSQGASSPDANFNSAKVALDSLSRDTGVNSNDLITRDNTLVFNGSVNNYTGTDDWVWVQLKDSTGNVVKDSAGKDLSSYIKPISGKWTWDTSSTVLNDGNYTLVMGIVDPAGSSVSPVVNSIISIDTSQRNTASGVEDKNAKILIDLISILNSSDTSADTGVPNDWVTNNKLLKFTGNFGQTNGVENRWTPDAGSLFTFQVFDQQGVVKASADDKAINSFNTMWATGLTAPLADGIYVARAMVTDAAGNVMSMDQQRFVVDTTLPENTVSYSATDKDSVSNVSKLMLTFNEIATYTITAGTSTYSSSATPNPSITGTFNAGEFFIESTDRAGNLSSSFANPKTWKFDNIQVQISMPAISNSLSVLGEIGTYTLGLNETIDLSKLVEDARLSTPAVRNTFDMSGTSAQSLMVGINDVLSLGVGYSFTDQDFSQLLIKGGADDRVRFKEASSVWTLQNVTANIGSVNYSVYSNIDNHAQVLVAETIRSGQGVLFG